MPLEPEGFEKNVNQVLNEFIQLCKTYKSNNYLFQNVHSKVAQWIVEDLENIKADPFSSPAQKMRYLACYRQALGVRLVKEKSIKFQAALQGFDGKHPELANPELTQGLKKQLEILTYNFLHSNKLISTSEAYLTQRAEMFINPKIREQLSNLQNAESNKSKPTK